MNTVICGKAWTCGNAVTVYDIIAENHWTMKTLDGAAMGEWIFEEMEPGIAGVSGGFKKLGYDIIVAGDCFGCGSKAVEHPMAALKGAGLKLVLAESVSRYSYRNAINLALPVITCPNISRIVNKDDRLSVNILTGDVENLTTGVKLKANGLGEFALSIIDAGGLLQYVNREA